MPIPLAPNDLGTDIDLSFDIAKRWGLSSGRRDLANRIIRRLSTPRGSMFYDLLYGFDVRGSLGAGFTQAELGEFRKSIVDEVEKEDAVKTCGADVRFGFATNSTNVRLVITDEQGPFDLVLRIGDLSVDILNAGQAATTSVATAVSVTAPSFQGPPGPAGAMGGTGAQGPQGPAGSGGTFGIPLVSQELAHDDSGGEVVIRQFTAALAGIASGTLTLDIGFRAASAAGTATFRAYVGGTFDAVNGTLVAQVTRNGTTLIGLRITGTLPNPTGTVPVKITMQSSGPGVDCSIDDLAGVLYG